MGKRELIIALAFVAAGLAAYQIAAPPAREGEGFSLRQLWNRVRAEMREDAARATFTHKETIPLPAAVTEIRLTEVPRELKVIGQDRRDLEYEFAVESTGPTPEKAAEYAKASVILKDELGPALTLRADYPDDGQQRARLILYLPTSLAVRLQSVREIEASKISALHLEGVAGDCRISEVSGPVTGVHSSGNLTVNHAGSVKLTLQGSQARFEHVSGGLSIDARNGELSVTDSKGPLEVNGVNEEITIASHAGPVRIGGSGGRVQLDDPFEETRIDMRRTELQITVRRAVPLTLLTTDEPLHLRLDGSPPIALDAIATEARVDASAFALQPDAAGRDQRLTHLFAPGGAIRVSLRNLRGDIVIGKLK